MYRPGRIFLEGTSLSSGRFRCTRVVLLLLALLFLFPDITPEAHASLAVAAAYTISGTVYNDYNQNGTQDNTASIVEPGLNGIIVTAFNAAGTVVTSATTSTVTSVLGQYSLSIPSGTGPVRVQFTNFGLTSNIPDLTGLQPSNHVGGTSVQFVSGASSTNTVNLGLERPAEYCQNQPTLATSCYAFGDQTASQPVLYSFPSSASGTSTPPTSLASAPTIGSTWGLAYRRSSDSLFASAYMKRHAGFKPSGSTGAIYLISGANSASPGTPSLFVDLNVAVAAGTAGANPHDTANYTQDNSAGNAYDNVGKVSLGGMAISDDESTLYVMNLADQKLYSIAVGNAPAAPVAGTISSTAVPVPASCTTSTDLRPFAVTAYHGLIYVGAVCSAESTITGPLPMGDPTKLMAYVFVYTPGSGFTTTPVFQMPLNYSRHCTNDAYYADCTASGTANINVGNPAAWNPWHTGFIGYRDLGHNSSQSYTDYAQPMLSTIAFDNGNLLLGLRDRFGDQVGNNKLIPDGSRSVYGVTAGDALRACLNTPGNFSSGWTLESNASCGGITTAGASSSRLGPGGGQYYYQNYFQFGANVYHDNTATGSIVQLPGSPKMTTTVLNPGGAGSTAGVGYDSNSTGAQSSSYQVYASTATNFNRSNGLGGLAAFCQSAPIEIGNRVWDDVNGNGIQDANESGIAGATVHLYASDGTTLLQTTTTDSNGEYYFTISAYTSYVLKLDNATDYASGGALQSYRLTNSNLDSAAHIADSNATLPTPTSAIGTGNYPTITVAAHTPGQNDDALDIGFIPTPAAYTVSGTVFNDYNQNGTQDNTASIVEPGVNGVVVTAYNAAGGVVTSATSSTVASVLGQYSLAIPERTGPVRIQFSNFGSGSTIPDLTGLQSSNHGTSGTSVQFVSGTSSTNTVNLGLERPAEYCQNQPTFSTNCYVYGSQTTTNQHVLVSFPSSATGTTPAPTALANSTAIGSTWGLAYRRSSDSLFASAFMKRHAGFKSAGSTGAIYLISGANSASPGTPSLFVDLNTALGGGSAGPNPHDTSNYSLDNSAGDAYDNVGKVSLGGMALSDDETTLYVMNLYDKSLYSIAVGTPPAAPSVGTINSTAVPVPSGCASADLRPFAVTSYHGLIYVGAVCSAESTVTGPLPMGDPTKLQAYIFVYTPGSGFTSTPIFQAALNYTRHCTVDSSFSNCTASGTANLNVGVPAAWNPWHTGFIGYQDLGNNPSQQAIIYPQPLLSTVAFDNGNLILGLRDRYGDQMGYNQPTPTNSKTVSGSTAGDTLRACLNTPGNFASGWTLESNAACGAIQTAGKNMDTSGTAAPTNYGPGGGLYYYQNTWYPYHDYITTGSILQIPGVPSLATTSFDPLLSSNTGGVQYDNNTTGALISSYQVYNSSFPSFGKANGLGDLVAFCQSAPIEIGNRVWDDTNSNGIQDAGEPGLAGVTVHLYSADGSTLLQTTTTNSVGEYYFTISAYTSYLIKLDKAADYASGGALQSFQLTTANLDTTNHLADSKASLPNSGNAIGIGNYPTVAVASHTPGQNDDAFDIGFTPPSAAYSVSGTVFNDYNQNGTQSTTEPGLNGVVVTAYNAGGTAVASTTTSTITNAQGQYSLALPAGTGPVRIQLSNFGSGSTIPDLTGLQPSNHGTSGTSVQFVSGASSTNTVNLGLERPAEYCQNQPTLSTNCYISGDQTTASQHVLVSFPSSASGTTPAPTALANSTDIGSTWGLAYRRSSDSLFAAAYMKRHSGFKPSGSTGAIYLISGANSASPGTPSLFVDLNVAVGAGTAGANPHDTANYNQDNSAGDAYDTVGKVSLGGMAISDDETTLYVMNLYDKKLYSIAVGTPPAGPVAGTISSTAVPVPASCTTSTDFRPFAVTAYHGLIYVGAVCSAESTVTGPLPLGDPTKLMAYVFVYTPGSGFTSTPVFQTALNYPRRCVNDPQYADCMASGSANLNVGNPAIWNPWHTGYIGYRDLGHNSGQQATDYPQPMLSTLAFDNGSLLLGLRDRYGDQVGNGQLTPDGSRTIYGITAGDALRACLNIPGDISSGWTLESNATCGRITTAGVGNTRLGPGGGQYYYQNYFSPNHDHIASGSVLQVPGSPSMVTTVFNPLVTTITGGVSAEDNTTGARSSSYQIYSTGYNIGSLTFGKSNGLGDLVAFCQSAPIEIGNRVWADTNGNGIQDAGEAGISGATVHLYAANGTTLLQTTTTSSSGEYYFTVPNAYVGYVVKLDNATDYASGGVLNLARLTTANLDTTNHQTDSKATLPTPASPIGTGNYPTVAVASHTPGQNDDSFDVGFIPPSDLATSKTVLLGGGNRALAATFTASSTYEGSGWGLANVHDGVLTSTGSSLGWMSNTTLTANHTEWIQLDLGASATIQDINLYPRSDGANAGYGFPIDFTIATSTDGSTWNPLITRTGYALPSGVQAFTFPTQTARYVRVTGTTLRSNPNDAGNYRMQFAEITVY